MKCSAKSRIFLMYLLCTTFQLLTKNELQGFLSNFQKHCLGRSLSIQTHIGMTHTHIYTLKLNIYIIACITNKGIEIPLPDFYHNNNSIISEC